MAVEDLNKDVYEMADEFGFRLVNELKAELHRAGKSATGDLISSFKHNVRQAGNKTLVEIEAEDYFRYVDKGRSAGSRMPPIEPIVKWMNIKGIRKELQFPIRKKIAERGIKPLNILNPTIDKVTIDFMPIYSKELTHFVGVRMVNDIFTATNTKGKIIAKSLR